MNRKGFRMAVLLLLVSALLSGCQDALYEMTEEEENVIVQYAAYVLAKHNIYQKDGVVSVNPQLLEMKDETAQTEMIEPDATQAEENRTEETGVEEEPSTEASEQQPGIPSDISGTISFAEAVGYHEQLQITYKDFVVTDNYQEGKVYSLDAHSGYQFVVARFEAKNISGASLDVDIMHKNITFKLGYDSGKWVKEDVTLLLSDLSTYTGTLGIEECVELVLLFEVQSDKAFSIKDVAFLVEKGDETYFISY